jgi:hypothetical protein
MSERLITLRSGGKFSGTYFCGKILAHNVKFDDEKSTRVLDRFITNNICVFETFSN